MRWTRPRRLFAVISASVALMSCAGSIPAPAPFDAESGGLAMSLSMRRYFIGLNQGASLPTAVLFVRLEEGETVDDLTRDREVIPSTLIEKDIVYLLNVRPGTYAAVAAFYGFQETLSIPLVHVGLGSGLFAEAGLTAYGVHTAYRNYFSRELIAETQTRVDPGTFAFMGTYTTDQSAFDDADDLQAHFQRVLEGQIYTENSEDAVANREKINRLSLRLVRRDRDAKVLICRRAQRHFKNSAWEPMIKRLRAAD